ncbi:MAG: BPL-N domain-containing protein [Desulfovibrionales bacterium]|nr:BPL-N domain-containing protein [Desulfovibrionales bacterium]
MSSIYILWDESHLWGLLVWRALEAMKLPYRIVRGEEIAQGVLSCNPPALLLTPGGNARLKAEALGSKGITEIQQYVSNGGKYLGFCGGAGLGLTGQNGLALCPWERAKFTNRLQHFVSGHLHSALGTNLTHAADLLPENFATTPALPVWWPARFSPKEGTDVEILASYTTPGDDFWIADLPLSTLPAGTFNEWEALYDLKLRPEFLKGQPCVLSGNYGKGRYVLSYTHLETPNSPEANQWLAHIIHTLTEGTVTAQQTVVTDWHPATETPVWMDAQLMEAKRIFDDIVTIGKNHCLFFERNSWLIGWRAGIPGANLNNLYNGVCSAVSMEPTPEAEAYWNKVSGSFMHDLHLFYEGVKGYLLAERLAMTLSKTFPETVSTESLRNQRAALFGPPMASGGLYVELLQVIDNMVYLLLPHSNTA